MTDCNIWGIHRHIIGNIPCFFFAPGPMTLTGQLLIEAHTDATEIIVRRYYSKGTEISDTLLNKAINNDRNAQCQPRYLHVYFDDTITISIYCQIPVQEIPT